jgi:pilus assembly protein Flp/PilA
MNIALSRLYTVMHYVITREEGQDLTQVGLIVALVALGATAGMNSVAGAVGSAFSSLSSLVSHASGVVIH